MKNVLLCSLLIIAGCAAATETFRTENSYIRTMPPGQKVTAAFLQLTNISDRLCTITGGSSDIASELQIHEHQHSDGMMRMRPVAAVPVAAGETVYFQPGKLHLMLFGVEAVLRPCDFHEIRLTTDNCGVLIFSAEVRSLLKNTESMPVMNHHSAGPSAK